MPPESLMSTQYAQRALRGRSQSVLGQVVSHSDVPFLRLNDNETDDYFPSEPSTGTCRQSSLAPLALTLPMNILTRLSLTFVFLNYEAYGTSSPVTGGQNFGSPLTAAHTFPSAPPNSLFQATEILHSPALFATRTIASQWLLHRRGNPSEDNAPSNSLSGPGQATGKPPSCHMKSECPDTSATAATNSLSPPPLPTNPTIPSNVHPPSLLSKPFISLDAFSTAGNMSSTRSQTVAAVSTSSALLVSSSEAQKTTVLTTNPLSISHSQSMRSSGFFPSSAAHAESIPPSSASPSTHYDTSTTTVTNHIGGSSLSSVSRPGETPKGAIIGAAVAGASALIVVLTVGFWLVWRRRRGGTLRQWAIPYGFLDSWGNEAPPPYVPSPALESQGGPTPTKEDSAPKIPMPTYGYTSFEPQVLDDNDSYFDPSHDDGESESHIHSDSDMGTVHTNPSEARLMDSSHPGREVLAPLRRVPTAASSNGE